MSAIQVIRNCCVLAAVGQVRPLPPPPDLGTRSFTTHHALLAEPCAPAGPTLPSSLPLSLPAFATATQARGAIPACSRSRSLPRLNVRMHVRCFCCLAGRPTVQGMVLRRGAAAATVMG